MAWSAMLGALIGDICILVDNRAKERANKYASICELKLGKVIVSRIYAGSKHV